MRVIYPALSTSEACHSTRAVLVACRANDSWQWYSVGNGPECTFLLQRAQECHSQMALWDVLAGSCPTYDDKHRNTNGDSISSLFLFEAAKHHVQSKQPGLCRRVLSADLLQLRGHPSASLCIPVGTKHGILSEERFKRSVRACKPFGSVSSPQSS